MKRKTKSINFILSSVGQADGILIPKLRKRPALAKIIKMKHFLFLAFFFSTSTLAQKQNTPTFSKEINSLLDSMLVFFKNGNSEKAFLVLDSAIKLDSTNIDLWELKGSWEWASHKFEKNFQTSLRQSKLAPEIPIYQLRIAMYYEKKRDSVVARSYFARAIKLYDTILDTINISTSRDNFLYLNLEFNRAFAKIFYENATNSNQYLFEIYKKEGENPNLGTYPYLNKSKAELLELWFKE